MTLTEQFAVVPENVRFGIIAIPLGEVANA
jgi:hypothetical protein